VAGDVAARPVNTGSAIAAIACPVRTQARTSREALHRSLSCKLSGMKPEQRQFWQPWPKAARFLCAAGLLLVTSLSPAAAQDIRGMEVCTAEKQMERRTSCLQANVEFLQQALNKLAHETQDKMAAADRDLAAARAEIAVLKSTVEKLNSELKQMKAKADSESKK
jgi:septal ring factor EnvC (AmiA/AmiB activator)